MIVGIHQPNFLPWLGYFRKILQCDAFVFYDNVQMPKGKSYVSRVQIKSPNGPAYLSVPQDRSTGTKPVHAAKISAHGWERKHVQTIRHNYGKSEWLDEVTNRIDAIYQHHPESLSELNIQLIRSFCDLLGISDTKLYRATELAVESDTAESILEIVQDLGATTYLTGTGSGTARHMDEAQFAELGCEVEYINNSFDEYSQFHGEFVPGLSIIDPLLCIGPEKTRALLENS